MNKINIGLVGPIASGKGVVADLLKEHGFNVFSLSDKVREEATSRGLPLIRENLQNVGDDLREKFGNQILAERTAFDLIGITGHICIDSIRNPGEIMYLKKLKNEVLSDIKIIGIDAPVEKRLVWYLDRARKRGEDSPNMDAFISSSLRDRGVGQSSNGQQVDACLALADVSFWNAGSISELHVEINKYLKSEFNFDPEIHRRGKEK